MITSGNFPKALVGGVKKQVKQPKKNVPQPKLAMMFARKGKRGS